MTPYYADDAVTLYHGDCRDVTAWLAAGVLVTDPPFGRNWRQRALKRSKSEARSGIAGDASTETRDAALCLWGDRPAILFGDLMLTPPAGTKLVGIYRKPPNAGLRGAIAGIRRDVEGIYLVGPWPAGLGGRSGVFATGARAQGGNGMQGRYGHPHAKPIDVMEQLIERCPPDATVADPFAGSGSTLVAARNLGRRAVGVEIEERYCETAARRLSQAVLPTPTPSLGSVFP